MRVEIRGACLPFWSWRDLVVSSVNDVDVDCKFKRIAVT